MNHSIFYIALNGNDRWSGGLPAPNEQGTDGPFATLFRARDAVQEIRRDPLWSPAPITVMVRGGKYFLDQTLVLTKEDSSTEECPIMYTAYPGEKPILSGGRKVTGWKPYKENILHVELPWSKGGKWKSRQLFFNGKRQIRARWPKFDSNDPIYGGWALMEGPAKEGSTTAFTYKPGTFRHQWSKPTEAEVNYFPHVGWVMSTVPMKSIDEQNRVLTLVHSGWQFDVPGWYTSLSFFPDNRFYVENLLEELDQPGEWCFDSEEGILYFWPPTDSIEDAEVVVPVLDCLLDIRGASWLTISHLTFTETLDGDNLHHEGMEGCGAMYPRPGWRYCGDTVHLKDAEHCRIENNNFDAVGGNAIYLEGYNARNVIACNEISGAGANGICLLGSESKHPVFNKFCNNHIHHCGLLNKYTAGVFSGMSNGNTISHNLIEYMPHHGINLSNSPHGRNIVEYNMIRFADQEIADSTAINCWMEDPPCKEIERCGHIIRFNYIADIYGCEVIDGKVGRSKNFPVSGIYLDNYTSNCFVYGNIIVRCTHAGILVHAGKNNLIENNIIVNCLAGVRLQDVVSGMEYWKRMSGFMTGNHILRNIFYQYNLQGLLFSVQAWTDKVLAQSDNNLFFRVSSGEYISRNDDNPPASKIITFSQWQKMGYDQQSVIADPLFIDPEHDDYRLKPDSPALTLGFQPIDMTKIGIKDRDRRRYQSLSSDRGKNMMEENR